MAHNIEGTTQEEVIRALRSGVNFALNLTSLNLSGQYLQEKSIKNLSLALKHNSTLTDLKLQQTRLSTKAAKIFSQALSHNSFLTSLDLSYNIIDYKGLKLLSKVLFHNSTLLTLSLTNMKLDRVGAAYLSQALLQNSTLTYLKLSNNILDKYAGMHLGYALKDNKGLIVLDVMGNKLGEEGARELGEGLKHNSTLMRLDINENSLKDIGIKCLCDALMHNSTLVSLSAMSNRLGTDGACYLGEALMQNSTLVHLDVSGFGHQFDILGGMYFADALVKNSTLAILDLYGTQLSNEGLAEISLGLYRNSTLRYLDLGKDGWEWYMGFGTKGLRNLSAALKHNAGLRMLLLNGAWRMPNKINGSNEGKGNEFKGGVKCLAEALKYNTTLTYLCLYDCVLGAQSALYMSKAIRDNSTLEALQMSANTLTNKGVEHLNKALVHNFTIQDLDVGPVHPLCEDYIQRNTRLATLKLNDDLLVFMKEGTMTDVIIRTNDAEIKAHKVILAARSSFFRTHLESENPISSNKDVQQVVVADTHSRFVHILLNYLYTNVLDIPATLTSADRHALVKCVATLAPEHLSLVKLKVAHFDPKDLFSTIKQDMKWAVNNKLFHDVVFVLSNVDENGGDGSADNDKTSKFFAHKVVLCARSSYFRAMLTSGLKESREKEIHLQDVSPKAFAIALEYLYTKDLNVIGPKMPVDLLIDIFSLASQYDLMPLIQKLEAMLVSKITVENMASLLVLADAHHATLLKKACCEYFLAHKDKFVEFSVREFQVLYSAVKEYTQSRSASASASAVRIHNPQQIVPNDKNANN